MFDEVVQKLGQGWTVEALVTRQEFRLLFSDPVLVNAENRLSGTLEPGNT